MPLRGPVLALDYGSRRIGLALSDSQAEFAFPSGVLERRNLRQDLAQLRRLVEERSVTRIVLGLPLHMSGRAGPEAEAVRAFSAALAEATGLEVELLDERWTTVEAERALRETEPRAHKRRQKRDAAAAAILLRTWLARQRAGEGPA